MNKAWPNQDLVVENKQSRIISDFSFISYDKFKMLKCLRKSVNAWKWVGVVQV